MMAAMAYDVIVVGLGGMGSAAAHQLSRRGLRTLGLDRFGPAHDRGSSHGGSRIVRQAYFEDPAYVPLLLRAYQLWEQLAADSGTELLTVTGGLMIGAPESRTVAGSVRSAEQWGLAHEMLDAAEIRRRFPTMTPEPSSVALYEAKAGFTRPEATVAAHLDLAARSGAELRFAEPVTGWRGASGGVRVSTGRGEYEAGQLVLCPGAWAPQLLADLGVPLTVERQVQYWFAPHGGPAAFRPARHPIYIWEYDEGAQFYGFPATEEGAKVAFFRGGELCTPETIDRTVHPAEVERMREALRPRIPALAGPLLRAATCMYTDTADEHFVIGRHPAHENVTVACGFSGHGFKFVPVVGEVVADLVTEGATRHPIDLFAPDRPRQPSADQYPVTTRRAERA